ncbi:NTP transferase domain-containing protein [Candidatus Woesearchaeota archaeon]|nr:NTP transferase domain-containing protein [Candidatus Woesearchaeota archaeon]
MKGILLAGGTGYRLHPLTKVTNKHLLAVYDEPMIYYPLRTLVSAGIKDIMIISGTGHAGDFVNLLGSGKEFGVKLSYEVQDEPGGIAHALRLAKDFVGDDNCLVILGDNVFDHNIEPVLKKALSQFKAGGMVFLKKVSDANRFGVAELSGDKVISIEEKPDKPKSNYAVTGLYLYDNKVFDIIKTIKRSARDELEISDVNTVYLKQGKLKYHLFEGNWTDAGTVESLYRASTLARDLKLKKSL